MKISKLFHWLYAILMLLPFLVFLPNAFYYGFNEHAVAQEKTEQVPVYYETNEVNSYTDLIVNRIYHYTGDNTQLPALTGPIQVFAIKKTDNLSWLPNFNLITYLRFARTSNPSPYILVGYNNSSSWVSVSNISFDFVYADSLQSAYINEVLPYLSTSDYQLETGETTPITTSMSITDSMSYAWDSVWQNDLFSWSYGSFLTEPFIYIGNVFNVPVDNSLYYALSYWLDISIIWLCFDMVMYIPLLVHRWLDKGIIE